MQGTGLLNSISFTALFPQPTSYNCRAGCGVRVVGYEITKKYFIHHPHPAARNCRVTCGVWVARYGITKKYFIHHPHPVARIPQFPFRQHAIPQNAGCGLHKHRIKILNQTTRQKYENWILFLWKKFIRKSIVVDGARIQLFWTCL